MAVASLLAAVTRLLIAWPRLSRAGIRGTFPARSAVTPPLPAFGDATGLLDGLAGQRARLW